MNNLDEYREVKSLKGLKSNEIVKITKYDLIKTLEGNRGEIKGFEEKRVKHLIDIFESGKFFPDMSVIIVNKKGYPLNGSHRKVMAERLKIPLLVRVLTAPIFNESIDKLIEIVTIYNSSNPSWTARQQFMTALLMGNELAIHIETLWAGIVAQNPRLKSTDLSPNQLMTILKRNPKQTKATGICYSEFNNPELLKYAKTVEFKEELEYIASIISFLKGSWVTGSINTVFITLFKYMWSKEMPFNKERFFKNLIKNMGIPLDETLKNRNGEDASMGIKIRKGVEKLLNM